MPRRAERSGTGTTARTTGFSELDVLDSEDHESMNAGAGIQTPPSPESDDFSACSNQSSPDLTAISPVAKYRFAAQPLLSQSPFPCGHSESRSKSRLLSLPTEILHQITTHLNYPELLSLRLCHPWLYHSQPLSTNLHVALKVRWLCERRARHLLIPLRPSPLARRVAPPSWSLSRFPRISTATKASDAVGATTAIAGATPPPTASSLGGIALSSDYEFVQHPEVREMLVRTRTHAECGPGPGECVVVSSSASGASDASRDRRLPAIPCHRSRRGNWRSRMTVGTSFVNSSAGEGDARPPRVESCRVRLATCGGEKAWRKRRAEIGAEWGWRHGKPNSSEAIAKRDRVKAAILALTGVILATVGAVMAISAQAWITGEFLSGAWRVLRALHIISND